MKFGRTILGSSSMLEKIDPSRPIGCLAASKNLQNRYNMPNAPAPMHVIEEDEFLSVTSSVAYAQNGSFWFLI